MPQKACTKFERLTVDSLDAPSRDPSEQWSYRLTTLFKVCDY